MHDPSWPEEDEWEPWCLIDPKDSFETRKHNTMSLFERRCRHCKRELRGIPPERCSDQRCQAMNVIGSYEPTSFRTIHGPNYDSENTIYTDYIQYDIHGNGTLLPESGQDRLDRV